MTTISSPRPASSHRSPTPPSPENAPRSPSPATIPIKPSFTPEQLTPEVRRTVTACLHNGDTNQMIMDRTGVTLPQLQKMKRLFRQFGDVVRPRKETCGRPRRLKVEHEQAMLRFLARHPTAYHAQVCWFLADAFDIKITQATISRALKRLGIVKPHPQRRSVDGQHNEQMNGNPQYTGYVNSGSPLPEHVTEDPHAHFQLPPPVMSRVLPPPLVTPVAHSSASTQAANTSPDHLPEPVSGYATPNP